MLPFQENAVASTSQANQSNPTADTQVQPKSAQVQSGAVTHVYPRITQVQPKPAVGAVQLHPRVQVQSRPKKLIIPRGMVMIKRTDVSKRNHEVFFVS